MKNVIVVCLILCSYHVLIQAVPLKDNSEFCEEEVKCIQTLNLDKNHVESIITDESSQFLPEDDAEFNKFLHCHWQARGLQNSDGTLNYDKMIEVIQDFPRMLFGGKPKDETPVGLEIAISAIEGCKDIPKARSPGQTAVIAQNCIDKRMMELIEKEV